MRTGIISVSPEASRELDAITGWAGVEVFVKKYAYTAEELDAAAGVPPAKDAHAMHALLLTKLFSAFKAKSALNPLASRERINLVAAWILSIQNKVLLDADVLALPDLAKEIVDAYVSHIRKEYDGRELLINSFFDSLRTLHVAAAPPVETRATETQSLGVSFAAGLVATLSGGVDPESTSAAGGAGVRAIETLS